MKDFSPQEPDEQLSNTSQPPIQCPTVTILVTGTVSAKDIFLVVGPAPSVASVTIPFKSNRNDIVEINKAPFGFFGGFGRVSDIVDSEDNLTHPPCFSNWNKFDGCSDKSYNNGSFFIDIQKNLDIGKAMGYNLDECFKRVKEIVEGKENESVLR